MPPSDTRVLLVHDDERGLQHEYKVWLEGRAPHSGAYSEDDLVALLKATVSLLCKTAAETAWVIKGQSFVIELGDWLHEIYPQTKNLFLYRHAETWLRSGLRAYSNLVEGTEEERRARENQRREVLGPLVPSIAQHDAKQPLCHAEMLALMWLSAMERYRGIGIPKR